MQQQNELLDAIEIIVNKALENKNTRVTGGVVKSATGGVATVTVAGIDYEFSYTGTAPTVGSTCRVFIPNGNMSDAFIGAGGGGGGGSSTTNYNSLTNKPKINGVELTGNKTSADLGVGDKTYIYSQSSALATWEINHNLAKYPAVSIVDSGGNVVIGDIKYIDQNNLTISFMSAFSGKAYLN